MLISNHLQLAIDPKTDKFTVNFNPSEFDTLRYKILTQREESHKDYANKTLLCFIAKGHTVEKFNSIEVANLPSYQNRSKPKSR